MAENMDNQDTHTAGSIESETSTANSTKPVAYTAKRINGLFLSVILIYLGVSLLFSYLTHRGVTLGTIMRLVVTELIILVPGVVCLLLSKQRITTQIPMKKIKLSTVFIMVLYTACLMPIASFANAISLLFTENIVLTESELFLSYPLPVILLLVGFYGPFCEEFVFRGIIFGDYRKSNQIWGSILLSSLLFGLMHMNINQFGYAFLLGIAFALAVEATGSIWCPFIAHVLINSESVFMMFLSDKLMGSDGSLSNMYADMDIPEMILPMIGVLFVATVFAVAIGACILVWMAKNEGREDRLQEIFSKSAWKFKGLLSWQVVAAMAICVTVIIASIVVL